MLAVLLAFVVRPVLVGLRAAGRYGCGRGERVFVLWTGLKGAVPILLGTFILQAGRSRTRTGLYEIIFVVVAFSVIVQGGLVPPVAKRLRHPAAGGRARAVEPGRRASATSRRACAATGWPPARRPTARRLDDLPCGEDAWVSFVIRGGRLVPVRATPSSGPATRSWSWPTTPPCWRPCFTQKSDNSGRPRQD